MRLNAPIERLSRLNQFIVDLERRANDITDSERTWWPFGILRLSPEEELSTARVATLSAVCGVPSSLVMMLVDHHARGSGTPLRGALFLVWVCVAFFAIYRSTFAYFWNRRADRLGKLALRRKAWAEGRLTPRS
jgi:hypothetical protein